MNKNLIIVLVGGFVVALLVAMIVQASFGSKKQEMVEIIVATKNLSSGADIKPEDVKWKSVPKDSVFEGAILREDKKKAHAMAKGRLRRDVAANEPLLRSALAAAGKGNILAATMEKGMRAIAIKVSADTMVGGFINPGDRVDVILTHQIKLSGAEQDQVEGTISRHATETVLENVKILAVDQVARKEDDKAKVGRTVTIEVDQTGAEKIALANEMGDLSLALRAVGDSSVASKKDRVTTDVQVSAILQEINRMKKHSGSNPDIVRVYSGDTIENILVRR
jgi:pilus assembly protein CpaB